MSPGPDRGRKAAAAPASRRDMVNPWRVSRPIPATRVHYLATGALTGGKFGHYRWEMEAGQTPANQNKGAAPSSRSTTRARERQLLALMAAGHSNTAIAQRLVISASAVEKHVSNVFAKLGLPPDDAQHRRVLALLACLRA
jgi:DNA-binding NarL/FixJ family response regulator